MAAGAATLSTRHRVNRPDDSVKRLDESVFQADADGVTDWMVIGCRGLLHAAAIVQVLGMR